MPLLVAFWPVQTLRAVDWPWLVPTAHKDALILYFGFSGCSQACPRTLQRLARELPLPHRSRLIFVDLLSGDDELAQQYARAFDSRFDARALNHAQRRQLRAYGINTYAVPGEWDLQHRDQLWLLRHHEERWHIRSVVDAGDAGAVLAILDHIAEQPK